MRIMRPLAASFLFPGMLLLSAPAQADDQSFIQYLNEHNIFVPALTDADRVLRGTEVCDQLHSGMTRDQIIAANPFVPFDLPGVIDAATAKLCPDTLQQTGDEKTDDEAKDSQGTPESSDAEQSDETQGTQRSGEDGQGSQSAGAPETTPGTDGATGSQNPGTAAPAEGGQPGAAEPTEPAQPNQSPHNSQNPWEPKEQPGGQQNGFAPQDHHNQQQPIDPLF